MLKSGAKFLVGALTGLAALALVCVLLLTWRLSRGPVALDFLTPLLQQSLDDKAAGYRVVVGRTVLDWSDWAAFLPVAARDVRVLDPDGRELIAMPRLSARLGVRALLRGAVVPTVVELSGPKLALVRTSDGAIGIAGQANQPGTDALHRLVQALGVRNGAVAGLNRLIVRNADVTLQDEKAGCVWRTTAAFADLRLKNAVLTGAFDLPLRSGDLVGRVRGAGSYVVATDRGMLRAGFADLAPSAVPAGYPGADWARRLHLPVTVEFLLDYTGKDGPVALHAVLSAGAGQIVAPDYYPAPLHVDGVSLRARWDFAARQAVIHEIRLRRGPLDLAGRGRLDFGAVGAKPAIALAGEVQNLALPSLMALWPAGVSAGGRHWIEQNLLAARIPKGSFRLQLPRDVWSGAPVAADAVDVRFDVTGVTAHYLGQLPPLIEASGQGILDARRLHLTIEKGAIEVPKTGRLDVHDGDVVIEPLDQSEKLLDIRFQLAGPAQAVLGLLDQPPLGYPTEFGISPTNVTGRVEGTTHFRFPTKKNLLLKEVDFDGTFRLHEFGAKDFAGDIPLAKAEATLAVDRKAITGTGTGLLAQSPAKIQWTQQLGKVAVPTRFDVQTELSEEAQAKLGLHLAPYLEGPVGVEARLEGSGAHVSTGTIKADLGRAAMALDWARWRKAAGEPAVASAQVQRKGDRLTIEGASIAAAGLRAEGGVSLGPSGALESVTLDRLVVGSSTDLSGSLRREQERWVIAARGAGLDASELLKNWLKSENSKPLPAFRLEQAHFDRLQLTPTSALAPFTATAAGDGKRMERLELHGVIPKSGTLNLRMEPGAAGVRHVSLTSPDGGFVLSTFGITPNVRGGDLNVTAELTTDEHSQASRIEGQADMRKFQIRGAPFLAKTLTLASLTGLRDVLQGQGLTFDRLEMPFEMRGELLQIEDARAVGSSLGITAHGTLDRKNKMLDIAGTLAPIYTLNSLLGRVPVLGSLLLRGKEGLIALRYSAKGPMADPKVSVNPLSVLTPGFLRGIFDLMDRSGKPHPEIRRPAGQDTPAAASAP